MKELQEFNEIWDRKARSVLGGGKPHLASQERVQLDAATSVAAHRGHCTVTLSHQAL